MRFHTTHHIYKFAVRKKVFEKIIFLEKSPVQPLPDGEAEFHIYTDGSLEALVILEKGNRFLDGILFWHIGYRGTFL